MHLWNQKDQETHTGTPTKMVLFRNIWWKRADWKIYHWGWSSSHFDISADPIAKFKVASICVCTGPHTQCLQCKSLAHVFQQFFILVCKMWIYNLFKLLGSQGLTERPKSLKDGCLRPWGGFGDMWIMSRNEPTREKGTDWNPGLITKTNNEIDCSWLHTFRPIDIPLRQNQNETWNFWNLNQKIAHWNSDQSLVENVLYLDLVIESQ